MAEILKTGEDDDIQKIESQREKLVELIESQFGLLEKLLKMHAITHKQMEQIRCEPTRIKINEMMLDYIFHANKHKYLITALSESSQSHVVNWIKSEGEYSKEFGFDWPLTESQHEILDNNLEELIDIIDNCELISMLYSEKVINRRQRDVLCSKTTSHEKNEELLGLARRLSQRSFQTMINCLKKSKQVPVADILENGGALVPFHATLESDNLDEAETRIVNAMTTFLVEENVSLEQANRLWAAAQLNIIAIRRGQSVVLYSWCRREDEFDHLCKIIDNLEIKDVLEQLFNLLICNIKIMVFSVKILESDVIKARLLFKNNNASISREPESQLHKVKDTIDRHHDFLVDQMFPDFVLLKKLLEDLSITNKQLEEITKKKTVQERNDLLIKYLIMNEQEEKLFDALDQSDQKHLVKYLKNDGKYIETLGGDWPLTNKESLIIQNNHEAFVDLIEIDDLIGLLYQTGVINEERQNAVLSQAEPCEKNSVLLIMLKRCSLNSYWQIIRCLRYSNQCRIADILETGGVVVRVDFKVKSKEISAQVVTLINNICNEKDRVKDERPLNEMFQLKLIGAKPRQGVSLYFLCNQSEEVDRLEEMAKDGRLKESAESFINQFKRLQEEIKVTPKWEPDIFSRSRALIQAIRAEEHISHLTPTTINSIPLELTDIIIQKSFAIFINMKSQTLDGEFLECFRQLAEVNVCWFKRMTKERFKNYRRSYHSGICEKKNSISTFWKNNRQFIEENVFQIKPGPNRLKNQDLLSDTECALIKRKPSFVKKASNKATDISHILNYKNETNMNLFIEYLRLAESSWISKAMRNCGISVRVEIRPNNRSSIIEDEKITRFFEDSACESLGSVKDRDFVRWIWCKSSDHKEWQQSKDLRHPLSNLVEESFQRINEVRINADSDQLKMKAVVLPHLFDESLETIDEQSKLVGVTKLGNELYCLNSEREMRVFYDRYPFVLLRKFQLKEVKIARDIVSCEKENALYILDIYYHLASYPHVCVWKIKQSSKTNQSEIKWLQFSDVFQPETLYMSKSDQLLMVSGNPSLSLRIYGPDAQLHLLIDLHQCIKYPLHAVETSTGNFVILHAQEKTYESTVTTLSRDGKTIVHDYQPKPENEEQRLNRNSVGYLSIDSNDRVFVADSDNDRVILLDSNLRWNQVLFPDNERKDKDSLKKFRLYPRRLYYDEGKKQLVVCGFNGIVFFNKF